MYLSERRRFLKKKVISLLLSAILVFSCTINVSAAENDNKSIDEILIERGYPISILQKMSDSTKATICDNPNLIYENGFTLSYQEENGQLVLQEVLAEGDKAIPYGQIPTADLELTWTVSLDTSARDNERLIVYSYQWKNLPVARFQDPMSVSWDGDYYSMKSNSFHKVDQYEYTSVYTGVSGSGTHSSEAGYASASKDGVTWYADLKGYIAEGVIRKLYGHGQFILVKDKEPSSPTRLYGHYIHSKISTNLSVVIPDTGEFQVSGGSSYDERGTDRVISF